MDALLSQYIWSPQSLTELLEGQGSEGQTPFSLPLLQGSFVASCASASRVGRESHRRALQSRLSHAGTWWARHKLRRDGERIAVLGSLSHRLCHIFGSECRVSPRSQLRLRTAFTFPLCKRRKGSVVALASPHPPSSPPSPSSSSSGKGHLRDAASLPAPSGPPCNF